MLADQPPNIAENTQLRMILAMNAPAAVDTTHQGELFRVEVLRYRDDDGRSYTREIVRHPGAVLVLPVLDDGRIVMIRNYRVAVDERLWELPAGKLEPGEPPLTAAGRELIEETGYKAGRIRKLSEFYTSPGFADERMHVFVADQLTSVERDLQPGEDIEVQTVERSKALEMIHTGELRDGKTIAALLIWDAQRPAENEHGMEPR